MDINPIMVNKAETTFEKAIPFKVYLLENGNISGTSAHTHDYVQIWYVMNGCCEHQINQMTYPLTRGSIFVLPPFVIHKISNIKNDLKIIGCEFLASLINENIPDMTTGSSLFDFAYLEPFLVSAEAVRPRLHLTGQAQSAVEGLYLDMLNEYTSEKKYYELSIKADLLKLLAMIAREYENESNETDDRLFQRYKATLDLAVKYIHENYTSQIYFEDVCKIAMMSTSYFSHLFKQLTGKTFVEYITDMRIRKAMDLLVGTTHSITDVCLSSGFSDITYFNRVFKKKTGVSPRQYRNLSAETDLKKK